ncbi:ABC transporter permease, partial [Catellatospora citrea]
MTTAGLAAPRLRWADLVRVGAVGLRTRPTRALLSALGIAIGIAAMVAVVGISASSRAELDQTLDRLGTNLLTVSPGSNLFGQDAKLPLEAATMIERIGPVTDVSAVGRIDAKVYRTDRIPKAESGSLGVRAVDLDLPATVGAELADGTWLNAATARYPATVLGATAASRLGVTEAGPDRQVWLGDRWFTVIGILRPVPLAAELDSAALVGGPAAESYLGFDGHATTVYTRSPESQVEAVSEVLAATANPEAPNEVKVSRPSDALAAQLATDR